MIFDGMRDAHPRVVYAAIYTLAQFCSYLDVSISQKAVSQPIRFVRDIDAFPQAVVQERYGEQVILSLLRIVDMDSAPERLLAYACSAFINLTSDIGDKLPQGLKGQAGAILERLLGFIGSARSSADVRRRAMSAAAQTARTLGDHKALSQEYCEAILTALWPYLRSDIDSDMKANAIDCATLAGKDDHDALSQLPSLI